MSRLPVIVCAAVRTFERCDDTNAVDAYGHQNPMIKCWVTVQRRRTDGQVRGDKSAINPFGARTMERDWVEFGIGA